MSLFFNNKEISELYINNQKIDSAYFNSTLVYTANPYEPNTILKNQNGPLTFDILLPKGVYNLILIAGGGNGTQWAYGGDIWGQGGGSGAGFIGDFYNPIKQSVTFTVGSNTQPSFMNFKEIRMITCNQGTNGSTGGPGGGGTIIVDESLQHTASLLNGKNGSGGLGSGYGGASISTVNNWGQGGGNGRGTAGGIILKYVRTKL